MAQLKIDIVVNEGGAESKLADVEARIKSITQATGTASAAYAALEQRLRTPDPGILAKFAAWRAANIAASDSWVAMGKRMQATGNDFSSIGRQLTVGLTAPIVAVGGFALKAAIDFEKAFSGVGKTVDGVMDKTGKLTRVGETIKQQFRDMAKRIPVDLKELSAIGEMAGAMGIHHSKLAGFTEVIAKVSATTDLTAEAAAAAIGKVQNVMGTIGVDTDRFAATLVALGNAGASTESQIMAFSERMGGAANTAKIAQHEVLGWANAIASVGVQAELGSTAWNRFVDMVGKAVDLGGSKLEAFAKITGQSAEQFKTLWKTNANEALLQVVEGLGKIQAAGGNLGQVMSDLGMKSQGFSITFKNLIGFGPKLRESLDLAAKAWQDNTALEEEFAKKAATTAAQLKILFNRLYDVAVSLGDQLIPHLKNLLPAAELALGGLTGLVKLFSSMPTWLQASTIGLFGVVAALGPLAWAIGNILSLGGSLIVFLGVRGLIPAGLLATQGAALTAGGALTGLALGPVAMLTAALAGLAFAVPKALGALSNLASVWQQGGIKALLGEVGRNVKDDNLSFFRSWRLDQRPSRRRGGAAQTGDLPVIDPNARAGGAAFAAAQDELKTFEKFGMAATGIDLGDMGGGKPTSTKKTEAQKAAEAAAKALADATGRTDITEAQEMLGTLAAAGGLTRVSEDWTRRLHEQLDKAISAYQRLGQVAPAALLDTWVATLSLGQVSTGLGTLNGGAMLPGRVSPDPFLHTALFGMGPNASLGGAPVTAGLDNIAGVLPGAVNPATLLPQMPGFFGRAFGSPGAFGANLSGVAMQALTGGGDLTKSIGGMLGGQLFGANGLGGMLSGMASKAIGGGMGSMLGGALGSVVPVIGTMIGSVIGPLIGKGLSKLMGKLGIGNAGRDLVKDFVADRGGFNNVHKQLLEMGDAGEKLWVKLTQGVGRNNPEQAKKVIEEVGAALEAWPEQKAQAIADILSGVNTRAENLSSQGDMDVVSAGAVAGFGLQLGQGSSAVEALSAVTPAIEAMRTAMAGGNFELSTAGQKLMELAGIIEVNRIPFQNLAADGQILQGMMQGNIRDFDLFRAVTTDIGVQMQGVIDKGVPTAQVLALAQPQLQSIWEAQQKWHWEVDATTQALINQAVQQGLVGEHVKSVHERILSVLLAIGDALGAQIPDALRGLPAAASAAADGMNDAFSRVRPPNMGGFEAPEPSEGDYYPNGGEYYHSGGPVGWRRMHRGGLASDEVPIIGQRGEYMISRRGVAANGTGVLDRINRGENVSGGGTVININNPIVDSTRRIEELAATLAKGGRAQTAMRHALRIS